MRKVIIDARAQTKYYKELTYFRLEMVLLVVMQMLSLVSNEEHFIEPIVW